MEMRSQLLKGAIWISGARIITNLLGMLSTIILARLLVPKDFGLVALGTTLLAIVTAVTDVPLTEALIQHRNPTDQHFHTAFTITMVRGLIIGVIFAALSWPASIIYKDHRMVNVMVVLAVGLALNGLQNPRAIMMTKNLIFWQQFMLQVAQRLAALIVTIGVAVTERSYWALLLGTLAGQLVGIIVSYTVLPFRPQITLSRSKELLSFSIWLTFCQIIMTINFRLDQLLIGGLLSKTQLGYYVVGDNLASMATREATTPMVTTVFPAFSRFADDTPRLAAAYTKAQGLITAVVLPIGAGVAIIADPLVRLAMGERWLPAIFIVQVLSAVFAFQTIGLLAQPLAMATGHTKLLFKRDIQGLLYRVPLILIGLYFDGFAGIVYARAFSGTTSLPFTTNIVTKITGLTFMQQMRSNVRPLISVTAMGLATVPIYRLIPRSLDPITNLEEILFLVPFGALIYLSLTTILWQFAGRPNGPETEVILLVKKALGFFKPKIQIVRDEG